MSSAQRVEHAKVTVISSEALAHLAEAIDPRYRAVIILGAGAGVRISEALGLTTDRVDSLRRTISVDPQLLRTKGPEPVFGPVKDKKNRPRVNLPGKVVIDALAAHIAACGSGPLGLIFTTMTPP
jgi:integrase